MSDITLVLTSSNRIEYFITTIQSLVKNCTDLNLINQIILIDDNSPINEQNQINKIINFYFPKINYIFFHHNEKSHVFSIWKMFDLVKTKYLFLYEDDWKFIYQTNYIAQCLDILQDNNIFRVALTRDTIPEHFNKNNETSLLISSKNFFYYKSNNNEKELHSNWHIWPYFTFNPAIINFDKIKQLNIKIKQEFKFEYKLGLEYAKLGLKTSFLPYKCVHHIGEISAYKINNCLE